MAWSRAYALAVAARRTDVPQAELRRGLERLFEPQPARDVYNALALPILALEASLAELARRRPVPCQAHELLAKQPELKTWLLDQGQRLLAAQGQDGLFSEAGRKPPRKAVEWVIDLSQTEGALLALAAAERLGLRVDEQPYRRLAETLKASAAELEALEAPGAFEAQPDHGLLARTTLITCRRLLHLRLGLDTDAGIESACAWLRKNLGGELRRIFPTDPEGHPAGESGDLYLLFSLERAAALAGDRLEETDWYQPAALGLEKIQAQDGSWGGPRGQAGSTQLAVIFLARATPPDPYADRPVTQEKLGR